MDSSLRIATWHPFDQFWPSPGVTPSCGECTFPSTASVDSQDASSFKIDCNSDIGHHHSATDPDPILQASAATRPAGMHRVCSAAQFSRTCDVQSLKASTRPARYSDSIIRGAESMASSNQNAPQMAVNPSAGGWSNCPSREWTVSESRQAEISETVSCPLGQQWISELHFYPGGGALLSAHVRKALLVHRLSRMDAGCELRTVTKHTTASKIGSAEWCPRDDGVVKVADYDGVISRMDVSTGHVLAEVDEHGGHRLRTIRSSTMRPGYAASAGDDGGVRLWSSDLSASAGRLEAVESALVPVKRRIWSLAWLDRNENQLLAGSAAGTLALWDIRQQQRPVVEWQAHNQACCHVAVVPCFGIVTAGADNAVRLWRGVDCSTSETAGDMLEGYFENSLMGFAAHKDAKIATGTTWGTLHVTDMKTQALVCVRQVVKDFSITSAVWGSHHEDASLLAVGCSNGRTHVLDMSSSA
jgi:WD40 repeat protein